MAEYIIKTNAMPDAMCTGIACRECSFDSADGCKLLKFFSELPTIDIVHCSECKYWQVGKMDLGLDCHTYPNHFCAEGERKTDD